MDGVIRRPIIRRLPNSKVFGDIPEVPVGTRWNNRQECSDSGVHRGILAGIFGNKEDGAYSVVLSGGYEDDEDKGDVFVYTGAGGRDTGGDKQLRMGPQAFDQTFDNRGNRALLISTQTRKPVRVVRGYNLDSDFAPAEGYRYDGLYRVEKAWHEEGKAGHLVCKFFFRRLPEQPPIPRREGTYKYKPIKMRTLKREYSPLPEPKFEGTRPAAAPSSTSNGEGPSTLKIGPSTSMSKARPSISTVGPSTSKLREPLASRGGKPPMVRRPILVSNRRPSTSMRGPSSARREEISHPEMPPLDSLPYVRSGALKNLKFRRKSSSEASSPVEVAGTSFRPLALLVPSDGKGSPASEADTEYFDVQPPVKRQKVHTDVAVEDARATQAPDVRDLAVSPVDVKSSIQADGTVVLGNTYSVEQSAMPVPVTILPDQSENHLYTNIAAADIADGRLPSRRTVDDIPDLEWPEDNTPATDPSATHARSIPSAQAEGLMRIDAHSLSVPL